MAVDVVKELLGPDGESISKSQVTITPPGTPIRFAILGGNKTGELLAMTKQNAYGIYYEMYRQHPILRAGVEKISKYAVANGYHFEPDDPNLEINKEREKTLKKFLRKSNAIHLLRITYKDILIYGEGFWVIERTLFGTPIRAMRLHPKYMSPILSDDDEILGWEYGPGVNKDNKKYRLDQILHFRLDDPDTDLQGLSLLHSLQLTIASDLNAMHFNGNFFENSAQTGMVIILKTSGGEEAKRNRAWLDQNYVGPANAHRPLLLEGDVDVKQGVSRPADMQYVEGRQLNRQEIMTVLDIPPEKLNIVEDFRRRSENQADDFQSETINPLQSIVVEEINNKLVWEIFGWSDIMFAHNESNKNGEMGQAKLYDQYEKMGVLSINQIAAKLGWPKVEGGDGHFVQTAAGMIPVEILDDVAKRLIAGGQMVPDPISGLGTNTTGDRNPPKNGEAVPE